MSTSSTIARALQEAIQAERDGASFYLMAAATCEDARGKEIFKRLADEELDHQEYLSAQYQSVTSTGQLDPSLKLTHKVDLSGESPIFSPAIKDRIKDAHFEMSALSIGIQLEQSAMDHYSKAADSVDDPSCQSSSASWSAGRAATTRPSSASRSCSRKTTGHRAGSAPFRPAMSLTATARER